MRGIEGVGDLYRQVEQPAERERPVVDLFGEGAAFEQLQNQERAAILIADFMNRADMGVVEGRGGARLAKEPFTRPRRVEVSRAL